MTELCAGRTILSLPASPSSVRGSVTRGYGEVRGCAGATRVGDGQMTSVGTVMAHGERRRGARDGARIHRREVVPHEDRADRVADAVDAPGGLVVLLPPRIEEPADERGGLAVEDLDVQRADPRSLRLGRDRLTRQTARLRREVGRGQADGVVGLGGQDEVGDRPVQGLQGRSPGRSRSTSSAACRDCRSDCRSWLYRRRTGPRHRPRTDCRAGP